MGGSLAAMALISVLLLTVLLLTVLLLGSNELIKGLLLRLIY